MLLLKPVPKALIHAGTGNGSIADPTEAGLKDAVKRVKNKPLGRKYLQEPYLIKTVAEHRQDTHQECQ